MFRILIINLGTTSTKVSYYEDELCVLKDNLPHPLEETQKYFNPLDQYEYRKTAIENFLKKNDLRVEQLDAVISRGGNTEPTQSGVYRVTPKMLEQQASGLYGRHAADLGTKIAYEFSTRGPLALTADTPMTDEMEPFARYTGMPPIVRHSRCHALNHKAVAKRFAKDIGKPYEELNMIGVHMGGGTTIVAHKQGRMVDVNGGLEGDGPFATDRSGSVPTGDLARLCFSGEYTFDEVRKMINGEGGMLAHTGELDVKTVEDKAKAGNEKYAEVLGAMAFQTAKEIGARATVLFGKVDAILFTGGISNSEYFVNMIKERVSFIAPIFVYPGEMEMESLANYAYLGLVGKTALLEL